jgi:hypothetical protein
VRESELQRLGVDVGEFDLVIGELALSGFGVQLRVFDGFLRLPLRSGYPERETFLTDALANVTQRCPESEPGLARLHRKLESRVVGDPRLLVRVERYQGLRRVSLL